MLRGAFNTLTRLHGRAAQLKRLGSPDIYSPCRVTPSNFFRFIRGPESTVVHGREFIIPLDTMSGQFAQLLAFSSVPTVGTFKLSYNSLETTDLNFDIVAADVQIALRLLTGLEQVLVTGDTGVGFTVVFSGFSVSPLLISATDASTLKDTSSEDVSITISQFYQAWANRLKRGDKIIDSVYGMITIDEIIEMVDIGGAVMGFRCHCE